MIPEGYAIRPLVKTDAAGSARAYRRNRVHLQPWEPRRDEAFYTERGQAAAIAGQLAAQQAGTLAAFVITCGDEIVGRLNLNHIIRGVLQSASIGYWVDVSHLRRGLATAAVAFACEEAVRLGLHRVEAGTQVDNKASQRVLLGSGFEQFGLARNFLYINGAWRDHTLYERILHDAPL